MAVALTEKQETNQRSINYVNRSKRIQNRSRQQRQVNITEPIQNNKIIRQGKIVVS